MTTSQGRPSRTTDASPRLPGSIVLKMALGEAPDSIPVSADVLRGRLAAAQTLDGGVCDRLIRHYAGGVQVSRVHAARALARSAGPTPLRVRRPRARLRAGPHVPRERAGGHADRRARRFSPAGDDRRGGLAELHDDDAVCRIGRDARPADGSPGKPCTRARRWPTSRATPRSSSRSSTAASRHTIPIFRRCAPATTPCSSDAASSVSRSICSATPTPLTRGPTTASSATAWPAPASSARSASACRRAWPARRNCCRCERSAARGFQARPEAVGIGATTDLDMAVKIAVDLGAKVLNMSFGTDDAPSTPRRPSRMPRSWPTRSTGAACWWRRAATTARPPDTGRRPTRRHRRRRGRRRRPADRLLHPGRSRGAVRAGRTNPVALDSTDTRKSRARVSPPRSWRVQRLSSWPAPRADRRRSTPRSCANCSSESATPFPGGPVAGCGAGVLNAAAALNALDAWIDRTLPDDSGLVEDG